MKITGIILAGGRSSRMGEDKGLVLLNKLPMISYVINALKEITDEIIIIANNKAYDQFGLPVYSDIILDKGPIGGIYTGLNYSKTELNIILSCDSPFMTSSFLKKLIEQSADYQITIPSYEERIHPTIGIYKRDVVTILEQQIAANELKLLRTIEKVPNQIISFSSSDSVIDPKIFSNINTKQDLTKNEN